MKRTALRKTLQKLFAAALCVLLGVGVFGAAPAVFAAPAVGAHDFFVSPAGDDAAPGNFAAPLKTVAAAKERLKALGSAVGENETVHV